MRAFSPQNRRQLCLLNQHYLLIGFVCRCFTGQTKAIGVNNTKGAGTLDASDQNALETECAESSKISAITTLEEFARP